jgi:hypothetical protein
MPLFIIDSVFIDRDIEFIPYGINHKSLRPTPNIITAAAQKWDLHSRGAEPGIRTRACRTAKDDELLFGYAAPYYSFLYEISRFSSTEKT